jgi:hypothetical protein
MLSLATATAISAVAATVAVELLVMWATAGSVLAALVTLLAVVTVISMMAVLPVLARPLFLLPVLSGWSLLLDPRLARCFRGGRRGRWSDRGVLSRDGGHGRRRGVDVVASLFGDVWGVRVRLASGISGRTAVRARATATTVRASAFGHATMFVMGCVLAVSR